MDLFAFIRHSDPTKVRIWERDLAKREEPSVERDDDVLEETVAKGASKVVAHKTKKKQKRKVVGDASGTTFPPNKLREDYHVGAFGTRGKSLAIIRKLVPDGSSVLSGATGPPTIVSVSPTPDDGPTDFVSSPNLRTCPPSLRFLAKDVPVTTVVVTTTVTADASIVPPPRVRVVPKNLEIVADSTSAGGVNADVVVERDKLLCSGRSLYSEFNVGAAQQVCLGAEVRMQAEHTLKKKGEIEDEAVETIRLLGQLTVVKAADAAKGDELRDLKENNFTLEGERDVMSEKNVILESTNAAKEFELASLSSQVSKLTSDLSSVQISHDELDSKKNSLESDFELFIERMEAMQDEQEKILGDRSFEYLQALWQAIGYTVNKGIQDGLKAGIHHGQAGRDLSVIEAYDPSTKAKYIDVVNAFGVVDFSLLSELESKKDSCIVDLMDSIYLEGTLAEIPGAKNLQPSPEQLMLSIHRSKDGVVIRETYLSSSLQASTSATPITTLSTTFASFDIVLPTSVVSDQFLDEELHNEDPSVMTFKKEELGTFLE
nr:hypothetical protein [Tanacetum cinerariifolium]